MEANTVTTNPWDHHLPHILDRPTEALEEAVETPKEPDCKEVVHWSCIHCYKVHHLSDWDDGSEYEVAPAVPLFNESHEWKAIT